MRVVSYLKSTNVQRFFAGGVLGGILAIVILFISAEPLGFPFPPLAIFQLLIAPVPGSVQSVVVDTFREYAKYSAFLFSSAIYAALYGVIAVFLGLLFEGDMQGKAKMATLVGTTIPTVICLALQLYLASSFSAISSLYGWVLAILLALGVNLVYAKTAIRYAIGHIGSSPRVSPTPTARRGFLKKAAIGVALLGVLGIAIRVGLSLFSNQPVVTSSNSVPVNPQPEPLSTDVPAIFRDARLSDLVGSEVTDNRVFYRVDIDPILPKLNEDSWTLKIHGEVKSPLTLTNSDLSRLPTVDQYATLECISNTIYPAGGLISNAKWTGVQLSTLLNQAGISPYAKYVIFRCGDGYSVGIPIELALLPNAILAYKMNDAILPDDHGFPLRAIVPGIYGMMNAKWITEIEVTDRVYLGYWQERGWSNDARIKTTSILDFDSVNGTTRASVNEITPIGGVAFAGDRGISKVEVSFDGGKTWNEATLKQPTSPYSWVLWAYEWTPTKPGTVTIVTRAYDGKGQLQDATVTDPFPDGASGYSSMQVTVT
jgi:DMSO/TMAO reductase YedYZ molybdopterin-dependent catalytic subunit